MSQEHVIVRAQENAEYFNQEAQEEGESLREVFTDVRKRQPNATFEAWVRQQAIRSWQSDQTIKQSDRTNDLKEQYIAIFVDSITTFDRKHFNQ